MTSLSQIQTTLSSHKAEFFDLFRVKTLAVFGSYARNDQSNDSDVDVLVEFEGVVTYDAYFGLQAYLQALLGRTVDLVTEGGLKPRARQNVEKDLVRVTSGLARHGCAT